MHSSTSSSESGFSSEAGRGRAATARATVLLLAGIVALCVTVELGTRLVIHQLSNTLGRIRLESSAARNIRPESSDARQLLIVGNSLLIAGVDVDALNEPLQPKWHGVRFGIEQTTYYDWYYGLKRLTADGARPSAILLCFEPRHLIGSSVRTEIFAHYLMRTRDTLEVSQTLQLSPTGASDLFFANVSAFWALRKEIRKNVLGRLMPELPQLTRLITRGGGSPPPQGEALVNAARTRLEAMRATADAAGAKLIVVLMPPMDSSQAPALQWLGADIGVPILTPLTDQDLDLSDYEPDQYHLNAIGRLRFTRALTDELLKVLQ